VVALRGVDIAIPEGAVVAMLGPNGAGKTTSISLMTGLRKPTRGSARLFGIDPHDRRAVLQLATETGREWVERRRREVAAALDEALERFSPADRTRLLRLLGKLNDELRAAGSKHALRYPALLASR